MKMVAPVLSIQDLHIAFKGETGSVPVVRGLSYSLEKGKILAVVGESGSGKTIHALSILGLLPPAAHISQGTILYNGKDLTKLSAKELRLIRGSKISMIFQDPAASLNPVLTIGEQLTETLQAHQKISKQQAYKTAASLLAEVGIEDAEKRLSEYPFQFSGGMCQRVMIAMALCLVPDILIADEPTTALDVTIQAQILRLIRRLQQKRQMASLFITHNLAVVAGIADEVLVLYGGLCMEQTSVTGLFDKPLHPYTQGLMQSLPSVEKKVDVLPAIEGQPPLAGQAGQGCPFAPRCKAAMQKCFTSCPPLFEPQQGHFVRCWQQESK